MQERLCCCAVGQLSGSHELPSMRGGWEVPNTYKHPIILYMLYSQCHSAVLLGGATEGDIDITACRED